MNPVFIDFETQSAADLREVGGRRYASHSSTRVLCLGVSWTDVNGEPVYRVWVPDDICGALPRFLKDGTGVLRGNNLPTEIQAAVDRVGTVAGHNATSFDRHIWDTFVKSPVGRWVDTIHMARAAGLPGGLDKLGEIFTGRGKDAGSAVLHKLMRLEWDNRTNTWNNKHTLPGAVESVATYCVRDVELLRTIYEKLRHHPFNDGDCTNVDFEINSRGVGFDEDLAAKIGRVSTQIVVESGAEIERITNGELKPTDLRSTTKMHKWLERQGVKLHNLRRETVELFINNPEQFVQETEDDYGPDENGFNVSATVFQVLRLRNSALRITGAKLERASAVSSNGRLHDLFVYHGAHTGRWTSRIVQVHNLPRGNDKLDFARLCDDCTIDTVRSEAARLGISCDDVLSALIRPCLVPKAGHVFAISDFSAIENRVMGWLANETSMLDIFRNKRDPYIDMASVIFGIPYEEVTKPQRQAGKVGVLGCQYGMGEDKLKDFAVAIGVDLAASGTTAGAVIEAFRSRFTKIAGVIDGEWEGRPIRRGGIWRDYETAFKAAIQGEVTHTNRCSFSSDGRNVLVRLPSGRYLCYRNARVEQRVPRWGGDPRDTIIFTSARGTETSTYGGKLTENIDQAVSRDLLAETLWRFRDTCVLHVHDEVVLEVPEADANSRLYDLVTSMTQAPVWAQGLPLGAEGHTAPRYTKVSWEGYSTCKA